MRIMGHGVSCPTIKNPLIRFPGLVSSSLFLPPWVIAALPWTTYNFVSSSLSMSPLQLLVVYGMPTVVLFKIFPPFGITYDFEATLLGLFLHSAMSTVEVAFVFLVSLWWMSSGSFWATSSLSLFRLSRFRPPLMMCFLRYWW